jgi:predicted  nucleic acid-binding Zn-ribbon protein
MGFLLAIFGALSVIFLALLLRSERKRENEMIDYAHDENYFRDEIKELLEDVDSRNKVIRDQSAELAAERRKVADLQNHIASLRKVTEKTVEKSNKTEKTPVTKKASPKKKQLKPSKKK